MDCRQARRDLSMMADGELAVERIGALEGHLGTCPDCARAARTIEAVQSHFGSLPRPEAPQGLTGRVMEHIAAPAGRLLSARPFVRVTAAAAAVLLVASSAALLVHPRSLPSRGGVLTADRPLEKVAIERIMTWIVRDNAPAVPAKEMDR